METRVLSLLVCSIIVPEVATKQTNKSKNAHTVSVLIRIFVSDCFLVRVGGGGGGRDARPWQMRRLNPIELVSLVIYIGILCDVLHRLDG